MAELTQEILVKASPATIFEFLTVPEKLIEWNGTEAELEPRPGGIYRVLMGNGHQAAGEFCHIGRAFPNAREEVAVELGILSQVAAAADHHHGIGNARGGTPLILPRWLYTRALAVTGDKGLRELVSGLPAQHRALLDLPSAAFDVDTPSDLCTALPRLRRTNAARDYSVRAT